MDTLCIRKELSENEYPGRGIIIGKSKCGDFAMMAYFIMGRSENSRNRIFALTDDGIKTEAFDPAKLTDPSLVIYAPVRAMGDTTIVTNGDQTDTVYEFMKKGQSFEDALRTREFEPDAPNFTPRISGLVNVKDNDFTYKMSILKTFEGDEKNGQRQFFEFTSSAGLGHFIHTYKCDGNPRIPSFEGEPKPINMGCADIDKFTNKIWESLNDDNKVSLFTRLINIKTGEVDTRIVNKNK